MLEFAVGVLGEVAELALDFFLDHVAGKLTRKGKRTNEQ